MGNSDSKMLHRHMLFGRRSSFRRAYSQVPMGGVSTIQKPKENKLQLDRYWIGSKSDKPQQTPVTRCYSTSQLRPSNSVDGLADYSNHMGAMAAAQAFKYHRAELLTVTDNAFTVVSYLLSNDVIPEATKSRIIFSNLPQLEKSEALLDAIEARIFINPEVFHTIVELLQSEQSLQLLAKKLLNSFRENNELYALHLKAITQPAVVRYADYLKAFYRSMIPLPRYKWPQAPSKKPFNLRLLDQSSRSVSILSDDLASFKEERLERGKPISLHYLMKPPEGCDKIRCVFLQGVAGVGKSSLTVELCRHWDDIEPLKKYPMVILVRAQEKAMQEAKTLTDLFVHSDIGFTNAVVQEVKASEGSGMLLILDGLDQSPPQSILLDQILEGNCLSKATLLITSRTEKVPILMSLCKRKVDRLVELVGFTQDEVEQHAESSLGYDSSLLSGFHDYISANPVVHHNLHVPLSTAIAVEAYKEARSSGEPPPTTLTELYMELTDHLLQYHLLLQGEVTDYDFPKDLEKLPSKVYAQFTSLAKQAFNALLNEESSWTRLLKSQYHLGFMIGVPELYPLKRVTLIYNYLHMHVQELLAAHHVKSLPAQEQTELYQKYFDDSNFRNVWKFLAGIDKFQCPFWREAKAEAHESKALSPYLMHCLYEAHKEVAIESVVDQQVVTFSSSKIGEEITPLDCYQLGCCLASSTCTLDLRQRLSTDMLHHLAMGLQTKSSISSTIQTLFLRPPITAETVQELRELPPSFIEGLDLSHCNLDRATADALADALPGLISLKQLDIRGNQSIGKGGMVKVLSSLTSLQSLGTLNAINTGMDCVDINALTPLISGGGHLEELIIGDEDQQEVCVGTLLHTTLTSSSLHTLHIWLTDLQPHVSEIKTLFSTSLSSIKELEFHGCKIGQQGCCMIAEGMVNNYTLTRLVFSMFDVPLSQQLTNDGAMALAEMLEVNRTLESLEIRFDRTVDRKGALALMCSLEHNKKLQSLKLPQQSFSMSELSVMDTRLEWL